MCRKANSVLELEQHIILEILNTRAALNRPKLSAGAFFRKQFGNYIGVKVAANYAQIGYSDVYSTNETQKLRNLSFNSNIWELSLSGDFNFFRFYPGIRVIPTHPMFL